MVKLAFAVANGDKWTNQYVVFTLKTPISETFR